jgi:general secretion pathway protein G
VSLVEILIVVVIIGILAAIAVPKFSNGAVLSHERSLKEQLRFLRTQLSLYSTQHLNIYPGYPGGNLGQKASERVMIAQLTQATDAEGHTSAVAEGPYAWGPYLQKIPVNPINGSSAVKMLAPGEAFIADGTTGWLYEPATGELRVNLMGADSSGQLFSDY